MVNTIPKEELLRICADISREYPFVEYSVNNGVPMFEIDLNIYGNLEEGVVDRIYSCEFRMRDLMQHIKYKLEKNGYKVSDNWKRGGNWRTIPGSKHHSEYLWNVYVTENCYVASLY